MGVLWLCTLAPDPRPGCWSACRFSPGCRCSGLRIVPPAACRRRALLCCAHVVEATPPLLRSAGIVPPLPLLLPPAGGHTMRSRPATPIPRGRGYPAATRGAEIVRDSAAARAGYINTSPLRYTARRGEKRNFFAILYNSKDLLTMCRYLLLDGHPLTSDIIIMRGANASIHPRFIIISVFEGSERS